MSDAQANLDPNQAIKSFFRDPEWRTRAGIGGVIGAGAFLMLFLHPLTIPVAFCLWGMMTGYYLRLMRAKIADANAPLPPWNDWLDLMISGITWIAVSFGQGLIPLSLATFALMYLTTGGPAFMAGDQYTAWAYISVIGVTTTWFAVSLISAIIMANFAKQERMSAAFDFFTVGKKLRGGAGTFAQAWLLMVGIQALGILIPTISVIGVALIPICGFITSCIGAILLAQAWKTSEVSD